MRSSLSQLAHHSWLSSASWHVLISFAGDVGFLVRRQLYLHQKAAKNTKRITHSCVLVPLTDHKIYNKVETKLETSLYKNKTFSSIYLSVFADVVKELASWDILHHHEDICWGANNLIPADIHTKWKLTFRWYYTANTDSQDFLFHHSYREKKVFNLPDLVNANYLKHHKWPEETFLLFYLSPKQAQNIQHTVCVWLHSQWENSTATI